MKEYKIKLADVGKRSTHVIDNKCECCGHRTKENPFEPLGKVLHQDVGKLCKKINGIWYVENQEQFNKRIKLTS